MTTITIYTKPGCAYCSRAKALLISEGVSYVEVEATASAREQFRELAGLAEDVRVTWPKIVVTSPADTQIISGSDELAAMIKDGSFQMLLV